MKNELLETNQKSNNIQVDYGKMSKMTCFFSLEQLFCFSNSKNINQLIVIGVIINGIFFKNILTIIFKD